MLKEVFARVLPVLGAIKHDNMRWVFAAGTRCTLLVYLCIVSLSLIGASLCVDNERLMVFAAIGFFCEAVLTYLANTASQPDALKMSHFSSEVFPAYEFIFNNWTGSKEVKVRFQLPHQWACRFIDTFPADGECSCGWRLCSRSGICAR